MTEWNRVEPKCDRVEPKCDRVEPKCERGGGLNPSRTGCDRSGTACNRSVTEVVPKCDRTGTVMVPNSRKFRPFHIGKGPNGTAVTHMSIILIGMSANIKGNPADDVI